MDILSGIGYTTVGFSSIVRINWYNVLCYFWQKLRLFDPDTGTMYATEASLESLLGDSEGQVCNGATIIIEYVVDDTKELTDLDRYSQ